MSQWCIAQVTELTGGSKTQKPESRAEPGAKTEITTTK